MTLYLTKTEDGVWLKTAPQWAERSIKIFSIDDVPENVFMSRTDWSLLKEGLDKGAPTIPSKYDDIDF